MGPVQRFLTKKQTVVANSVTKFTDHCSVRLLEFSKADFSGHDAMA